MNETKKNEARKNENSGSENQSDKLPIYEIINPSDKYTFRAKDDTVAFAVVLLLGEGKYACLRVGDGETIGGMLAFASKEVVDKIMSDFFGDIGTWLKENRSDMIEAFDSVLCMGASDRTLYEEAIKDKTGDERIAFRDKVHDERRSSMNNIGAFAWRYAAAYREAQAKEEGGDVKDNSGDE